MSDKYKSTKLLEAAIREHKADYRIDKGAYEKGVIRGLDIALGAVNNDDEVPAADVEPVVRGEWKEMRDPYGDLTGWIHEECGHETQCASNYCSKCGAKMKFIERSGSGELSIDV